MFSEKFKKASKNIKVSEEVLNDTREKMYVSTISARKNFSRRRAAIAFATAFVIVCAGIFRTQILAPQNKDLPKSANNLFAISAYAYDQEEEGTLKKKEIDLLQSSNDESVEDMVLISGGVNDEYKASYIKLLGIVCQGENIDKVDFSINKGTLKIPNENWKTEKLPGNLQSRGQILTIDYSEGDPIEVYWESDPIQIKIDKENGKRYIIGESEYSDKASLLSSELTLTITATAYFKDGSKEQKTIVYDASKGKIKLE